MNTDVHGWMQDTGYKIQDAFSKILLPNPELDNFGFLSAVGLADWILDLRGAFGISVKVLGHG